MSADSEMGGAGEGKHNGEDKSKGEGKVCYVFIEKKGIERGGWVGVYPKGERIFLEMPGEAVRSMREYKKEGYEIVYTAVPIKKIYAPYKYRELNKKERAYLEELGKELAHHEEYPGMTQKEFAILEGLKERA